MSGIYTHAVSRWLFPLHERLKGHSTVQVRKAMEDSQWWTAERLAAAQLEKLRAFFGDVRQRVPYYRDLFESIRFDPAQMTAIDDLRRIPFLTKSIIRGNSDALRARDASTLSRFNTGGSSGEPLVFFIGRERVSHDVAAKWRATRWWDVDVGDREIVVWGSPIELSSQDRVRALRDRMLRTKLLPAFEMSTERLESFVNEIRNFKPAMLFGYPSALSLIAGFADSNGYPLDNLGIKVAFVTSEKLYPHQRKMIEHVFGCRVANGYGGRDAGFIAHECPAGNMHITAEDIVVEAVGSEGNTVPAGEPGELVVTHMATAEFPFIRYQTGDIGVLSTDTCVCGRGLPLLKDIQGRATDFIVAMDGTVMHGLALIYILRDIPEVREFKIIQESLDHVRVLVVAGEKFSNHSTQAIQAGFVQRLGVGVKVQVESVDGIPAEKSGKFRYVVSRVQQETTAV